VRPRFDLVRVVGGVMRPPELNGTHGRLLVQQKGEVDIDAGHCLTVTYAYRYRATEQPDSWIFPLGVPSQPASARLSVSARSLRCEWPSC
jgi:hypothetical protein